jgi:predicted HTH transcriptional regulator
MNASPFSQEVLNRIFTISHKHLDCLISRESSGLEFKEAFGFQNLGKYIRSAGAFANAKGGYIVYGVANSPHKLIGLKDDRFDQLDPEKLTAYLSEHFDPELEWDRHLHELDGKVYGILYFHESRNKPVICRKGSDDGKSLKEGEIYYRCKGRTQTIRYAELKELIEERRRHEQLLWFKHLKEIARSLPMKPACTSRCVIYLRAPASGTRSSTVCFLSSARIGVASPW